MTLTIDYQLTTVACQYNCFSWLAESKLSVHFLLYSQQKKSSYSYTTYTDKFVALIMGQR